MGSELSQSQQVRNIFPSSEYRILESDKCFPDLSIFQKLSDSSTIALIVSDQNESQNADICSDHVLKIIDKKKVGKSTLKIYQWVNTHVYGLIEYITHIDKNRSISKSQFQAIIEDSVRGYAALSLQASQSDCLNIYMRCLRIFHSISLKTDKNKKQIVDNLHVKVVPLQISKLFRPEQKKQSLWNNAGQCIHKGGIHTQQQLLGHYFIQLSDFISKKNFQNTKDSLINVRNLFGSKTFKVISGLLENKSWKSLVEILDAGDGSNLIKNSIEELLFLSQSGSSTVSNKFETSKTINTQKIKSEKVLFKCFENQIKPSSESQESMCQYLNEKEIQKVVSERILKDKDPNIQPNVKDMNSPRQKSSLISNGDGNMNKQQSESKWFLPCESKRRLQNPTPVTPTLEKNVRQMNSPENKNIPRNDVSPRLKRTNSILTIYPDVFRNQTVQRDRIVSTIINGNVVPSLIVQNVRQPRMILGSPKGNSSILVRDQAVSPGMRDQAVSPAKIRSPVIQKRKGKQISFQISEINPTLGTVQFPAYITKTVPDVNFNGQVAQSQEITTRDRVKMA